MTEMTAGRALSGDPADAVLPVAFALDAVLALGFRRRRAGSE